MKSHTAEASEWVQDDGYNPSSVLPQTLPVSLDKAFWGSSHQVTADASQLTKAELARRQTHNFYIQGNHFVCTLCPTLHSLGLSTADYTLNSSGTIVPIDKGI